MIHFFRYPGHFINNLKLKQKLMLSYFVLILIPLAILTVISYRQAARIVENQVLFSAKQVFQQSNAFLSYKIARIVDVSNIIAIDRNVNSILGKGPHDYPLPEQLKDMETLTAYLKSFQGNVDIWRIRLNVNPAFIYSNENINLFSLHQVEQFDWYRQLNNLSQNYLWLPSSVMNNGPMNSDQGRFISLIRPIYDLNWYFKIIGILQIDVPEDTIAAIIAKANTTEHGVAYIQNSAGLVLMSSNDLLKRKYPLDYKFCKHLAFQPDNWTETYSNRGKVLVSANNINGSDWLLISVIPFQDILKSSQKIRSQMLLLMLVLVSIAYLLAFYIAQLTTKRIEILIQTMRKVQNADLNAKITSHSKDEIGELTENFNYMLERMTALVQEQYHSGQELKNAELKALQAQINPHFLYNTLDLINWSAIKNNIPEISAIVQSLAQFYKLSLNKGQDVVALRDEITHSKLYVAIQNMRFQNKIGLEINIEERLQQYSILKIILQPLVENSILHGIMEKDDKSGIIKISGQLVGNALILTVQDNGVGMSEEQLRDILTGTSSNELHGYGVRNIHERIKLFYGNEFGLSYESRMNSGTTVTIKIPAVLLAVVK
jgi:Predicted signal transduction protein with a C-terminal ATPase domain